ncbi:MAG: DUF1080 domain-containing protein [Planctomycetes bacterium]|nr:DUF1080 domain-containing protein [Planctomycetota bacterium]
MQLRFVSTSLLLSGLLALVAQAADKPEPATPSETIHLFNGKDLTNWYTWLSDTKREDPKRVFTVHDGLLHISGDGLGGIYTEREYKNYRLVTEFKWGPRTWKPRVEKTKDSGVLVHGVGPDGNYNGAWPASIEAQIIEGGIGDFIVVPGKYEDGSSVPMSLTCEVTKDRDGESVWHKGGEKKTFTKGRVNWWGRDPDWKDVLGFRGKQDVESPDGQWTQMEVVCDGGRVTIYVNGTLVNEGFDAFPSAGKIIVQTEYAEIFFRKIDMLPLKK